MFSAYDLKKIIPRAVFALVAINLSWSLMEIFINAVGALGEGAQSLIMAPFGENIGVQSQIAGNAASGLAVFAGLGAAAGVGLGLIPIAGVAAAGLFGILFAFGIVMLRRVFLIGLVVIAPIAIALSVFPQTEDWAKKWWDWFSKLLLMYPFIMAFFGLSEVAAFLVSSTAGTGAIGSLQEVIYTLAGAAILIAPYFLIGKALTFAGGTIAKVAGMVNNKDRGIIDRTKKWEGQKVAEQRGRFKDGTMRQRTPLGKAVNVTGRTLRNPKSVFSTNEATRAATILGAADRDASSLEQRHEAAKTLSSQETKLLAAASTEKEFSAAIEAYAEELRNSGKASSIEQARAMARATADSAKRKVGGKITAGTQLYSLKKGFAEGHIDQDAALAGIRTFASATGTTADQQLQVQRALAGQLDSAGGSIFSALSDEVNGGTRTVGAHNSTVNGLFEGDKALDFTKLAEIKTPDAQVIHSSKQQQVDDAIAALGTTTDPAVRQRHIEDLVKHYRDLIILQESAARTGKTALAGSTKTALDQVTAQLQAAESAGLLTAATISDQGYQAAVDIVKPIT